MPYSTRAKALTFGAGVSLAAAAETAAYFLKKALYWQTLPFFLGAVAYASTAAYSVIKNHAAQTEVEILENDCKILENKISELLREAGLLRGELPLEAAIPDLLVVEHKIYFNRFVYAVFILLLIGVVVFDLANNIYEGAEKFYIRSRYCTALASLAFVFAHVEMARHIGQQRDLFKMKYGEYVNALDKISQHIVARNTQERTDRMHKIAQLNRERHAQEQENSQLKRENANLEGRLRAAYEAPAMAQASSGQSPPDYRGESIQPAHSFFFHGGASAAADVAQNEGCGNAHPS